MEIAKLSPYRPQVARVDPLVVITLIFSFLLLSNKAIMKRRRRKVSAISSTDATRPDHDPKAVPMEDPLSSGQGRHPASAGSNKAIMKRRRRRVSAVSSTDPTRPDHDPEAVQTEDPPSAECGRHPAGAAALDAAVDAEQSHQSMRAAAGGLRQAPATEASHLFRPAAEGSCDWATESGEMPSFHRLPDSAFFRPGPALETSTGPDLSQSPPHAVAACREAGGGAQASHGDTAASPRLRPLLLACLFGAGMATGIGVAHVMGDAAIGTGIGAAEPVAAALKPSERRTGDGLTRGTDVSRGDRDAAQPLSGVTDLSAMMDRLRRQITEDRLDQPQGDNALDTYRQIAARSPNDAARAGQPLSAAFWLKAESARAAAHWDEALHYLNVLKTLPSAIPAANADPAGAEAVASPATAE